MTYHPIIKPFDRRLFKSLIAFTLFFSGLVGFEPTLAGEPVEQRWLPHESLQPGGIALVDISRYYHQGMSVLFNDNPIKIEPSGTGFIAVVGIPLSTTGNTVTLLLSDTETPAKASPVKLSITLQPGEYPKEHLTIADTNKVSPDEESMRRIRRETQLISGYLRNWQTGLVSFGPMILPVDGRHSSSFGRRRIINGQPRRPHSGLDIAAPTGTPVYSPEAGLVSGGGDFFFNGNSLFVDHGEGLISMFCHLDEILVQPGEQVKQGQLIARVGSSGRVTGPHLHWSVSLNDARVDPLLFLSIGLVNEQ